jgi:carbamate kinase
MSETVIVALGGNALQDPGGEGRYTDQLEAVRGAADTIADLLVDGTDLILTHGNGPQIGSLRRQNVEAADVTPPMPLFVNGAQTQGQIGFMIQSTILSALARRDYEADCIPVVTPVAVDPDDEAFDNPTKPIGPYLDADEVADLESQIDLDVTEVPGQGYRQVVPSPDPQRVFGVDTIRTIVERGDVPIAAGGGGVPVVQGEDGTLDGIDAVIDKDLAGARLGDQLGADVYLILTSVAHVALNYGEPDQEDLEAVTPREARTYMDEGHFARGSMYEKVDAACRFVEDGEDRRAIITHLEHAREALAGEAGTHIHERA